MYERVKDIVCGMEFDSEKAKATLKYEGKTYYFCSPGCKEKFETEPYNYLTGGGER